ncbi:hypothetical protein [Mycobacterium sp. MMS18-G62]
MHIEPESKARTHLWRDPLSVGWRAHRNLLMLRLRWHERRAAPASNRRRPLSKAHPPRRRVPGVGTAAAE